MDISDRLLHPISEHRRSNQSLTTVTRDGEPAKLCISLHAEVVGMDPGRDILGI